MSLILFSCLKLSCFFVGFSFDVRYLCWSPTNPDSRQVGSHLGVNTFYQGFFHTQYSNPRSLVKGGEIPFTAPHPLVVKLSHSLKHNYMTFNLKFQEYKMILPGSQFMWFFFFIQFKRKISLYIFLRNNLIF